MNLENHADMIQQQQVAPALVEKVASEENTDDVAEVCGIIEQSLREECQERGLGKHAGQAVCYLVVNRLANPEEVNGDD